MKIKKPLFHIYSGFFHCKIVTSQKEQRLFRDIWTSVWREEHYTESNTLSTIKTHYQSFDHVSTDILLYFLWVPIGTIRIIWGNKNLRLPVFADFETFQQWEEAQSVEWTLFTIKKQWRTRNTDLSLMLMGHGYKLAKKAGLKFIVAAVDRRLYCFMRNKLKHSFSKMGQAKYYEGSMTTPCILDIITFENIIKKTSLKIFFL